MRTGRSPKPSPLLIPYTPEEMRRHQGIIDDQPTTLKALLGAEVFDFLETRRGVRLGKLRIQQHR